MRKVILLVGLFLVFSAAASAQDAPKAELFGGYSYLRLNPGSGFNGINLNGWNASLAGNFNRWLGVVGDFSGQYGTPNIGGIDVKTNVHSFLFGPRISYRTEGRFTPFAQALFGVNRIHGSAFGVGATNTDFGMALGGGVDANLNDHFAVRLGQADYLLARPSGNNLNNFRYSAGIVFRFGR